ncbi:MAG: universal stress protein [Planctomycetes bacterium]|nr:universal stress protein [Planctomycetota bacterium]
MDATPATGGSSAPSSEHELRQLTPLLVWAVVFCDIGTSIYYVPGILYNTDGVGNHAPIFVFAAFIGFLLLAWKYVEICWRNPDGGGVVTVANQAFSPIVGCFGGLLISVDYFLTSAISSVSGIHYLSSVVPSLGDHIVALSVATLLLLAAVNTIGIRESASLALVMAMAGFASGLLVITAVMLRATPADWAMLRESLATARDITPRGFLIGFAGAWLAFSGLESISQLSPAMKVPIKLTAGRGMRYVVYTMMATSPILTLFCIALLPHSVKIEHNEELMSELGGAFGGPLVKISVVITASSLLLLAANTAIIGCYHVFLALAERGFLPSTIGRRNRFFGTPQIAILVATLIPVLVIWLSGGDLQFLGSLYAFGLLGAFVLSSTGLDVIRWRDGKRGFRFLVGLLTSVMVTVAWAVNLYQKPAATAFGSAIVSVGLLMAVGTRRKWFSDLFYRMPWIARHMPTRIQQSEEVLEHEAKAEILSLAQAESISRLYPSKTLIAMRSANPGLINEAIVRERGTGGKTIYALYVEEYAGLFVGGALRKPTQEGVEAMQAAARMAEAEGLTLIPIWTVSWNAVEGILRAAETLEVSAIMIGTTQRSAIYHLLRGHVLAGLTKRLPPGIRLLIYG